MAPGIIAIDIHHRSTLMKSDWFGTALAHPGFMHGLLCTVALHLYIFGKGNIDTILYHRARAIAAVNAAISSPDPQDGTSDANIGAVFNLLTVEESLQLPHFAPTRFYEDQPKQRAIHMNGLSRMIQLRGGLMEIQTNRILQAFILWCVIFSCLMWLCLRLRSIRHATTQAIFHLEAPDHSKWDYITAAGFPRHPPDYEPNISPYLVDCCRYLDIAETLITLVESVLVLTADLNVCFSDPGSALDPLDVQNFACALECMLLTWLRKHEHSSTPLEDALCMALLIFTIRTTAAMKRQSDVHLLHSAASRRLENALTCIDRTEWQNRPDLFLWISCIAAISADAATDPSWLVHQAALTCEACGIHSAQALSTRLQYCGWVSYKLGKAVYILWDSIVDLRLEIRLPALLFTNMLTRNPDSSPTLMTSQNPRVQTVARGCCNIPSPTQILAEWGKPWTGRNGNLSRDLIADDGANGRLRGGFFRFCTANIKGELGT